VAKHKNVEAQRRRHKKAMAELKDMIFDTAPKLALPDIDFIMNLLSER
jgi:hypothetical protein